MIHINIKFLPKKYDSIPLTKNKIIGGRINRVDTFLTHSITPDAEFMIQNNIHLLNDQVIIKIMLEYLKHNQKELEIHQYFSTHSHKNIIHFIGSFTCLQNPIQWFNKEIINSRPKKYIIIIQKYITKGSIKMNYESWDFSMWYSVFLQTMYACLELFEQHGFFYDDWKPTNILLDEIPNQKEIYHAYERNWIVENTYYVRPVFTDFSLCTLHNKEPSDLAMHLSLCIDFFSHIIPKNTDSECINHYNKLSFEMENKTTINEILKVIDKIQI